MASGAHTIWELVSFPSDSNITDANNSGKHCRSRTILKFSENFAEQEAQ